MNMPNRVIYSPEGITIPPGQTLTARPTTGSIALSPGRPPTVPEGGEWHIVKSDTGYEIAVYYVNDKPLFMILSATGDAPVLFEHATMEALLTTPLSSFDSSPNYERGRQ